MKTAVFASLIASAAAFAPSKTVQSSTTLAGAFDNEVSQLFNGPQSLIPTLLLTVKNSLYYYYF